MPAHSAESSAAGFPYGRWASPAALLFGGESAWNAADGEEGAGIAAEDDRVGQTRRRHVVRIGDEHGGRAHEVVGVHRAAVLRQRLELIGRHAVLPELGAGVQKIVGNAAAAFESDRLAAPAIVALRRHVDAVLQAEIARHRARHGVDERTEAALRHLAGVLLHEPSVRARDHAAAGQLDAVEQAVETLFGVTPQVPKAVEDDAVG